jgi:hypothetical protein
VRADRTAAGVEEVDHLLAQRQRIALQEHQRASDRSVGGLRRGADFRRVGGLAEGRRCGACHVLGGQRSQQQGPAARADGRDDAAGGVAHQQQERARRRFFQHLQQRVFALLVQFLDGIDDRIRQPPSRSARTARCGSSSTRITV